MLWPDAEEPPVADVGGRGIVVYYFWNHITYVPEYFALGLPVVARRDENSD